jgi:hypothetical protein
MITYIANTLFILFLLFWVWVIVCSIIYRDKPSNDLTGQSERQKKNDDYNTDYYPWTQNKNKLEYNGLEYVSFQW